jgi:diguanylate cyclase (GGDEF)-like protein/PAS domain S-box-containing protein
MNRRIGARQKRLKRRLLMLFIPWLLVLAQAAAASTAMVDLTEEEKQWLEAHPSVRLAVDIDWAPFEYIDDKQAYVGMAAEYIALVSKRLGIEFEVEKEKPWSEVVEMVKQRELDMYSCVVSTAQRREYVNFTRPYLSFPMVIVTSDQVAYVNGIKGLRNEKVAVVKGYATHDLMEKNHPEIDLYLADTVADALEKLSHGQVYAYIGNIATVSHVIKREGLTNIKISGNTPYKYELSMAVRKEWPEFLPILQKALDSISEQERDQIYRNWIKLRYEHGFDYALLWKVLAGVALIISIILLWNRRLSKEIDRRIEAEKLLSDAHQSLECVNKKLLDYVDIVNRHVITSSTDRQGTIVSTSAAFCEISGYSEEELIGSNHSIVRHADMSASLYQDLWRTITRGKTWSGEIKNRKKNGDFYWVQAYISPVFDERGEITGYTAIREDITSKKRAEQLSITDELTSLYNRRYFNRLFSRELARAVRDRRFLGLIIFDVDYFKSFNDNYGHQKGDDVLKNVALLLKENLRRPGDFAFRVGGEEFAAIVCADKAEGVSEIAEKLRTSVEDANIEHGYSPVSTRVTVSVGVKTFHPDRDQSPDMDLIYRLADDALYRAKENGRNRVVEDGQVDDLPRYQSN